MGLGRQDVPRRTAADSVSVLISVLIVSFVLNLPGMQTCPEQVNTQYKAAPSNLVVCGGF